MKQLFETYPNLVYGVLIAITIILVFVVIKVVQMLGFEKCRAIVYKAFVTAENHFNNGDERFEYVIKVALLNIPAPYKFLITENMVRKTIQLWFDICKDLLDDGKMNGTGQTQEHEG